jgi:hypothetical protein
MPRDRQHQVSGLLSTADLDRAILDGSTDRVLT